MKRFISSLLVAAVLVLPVGARAEDIVSSSVLYWIHIETDSNGLVVFSGCYISSCDKDPIGRYTQAQVQEAASKIKADFIRYDLAPRILKGAAIGTLAGVIGIALTVGTGAPLIVGLSAVTGGLLGEFNGNISSGFDVSQGMLTRAEVMVPELNMPQLIKLLNRYLPVNPSYLKNPWKAWESRS